MYNIYFFFTVSAIEVAKNQKLDHIPIFQPYYEFSFDLIFYKVVDGYSNIIHATPGPDHSIGSRNPAIWVHPRKTIMNINAFINGKKDFYWTSQKLPLHKSTKIVIRQSNVNGKLLFRIYFDGVQMFSIENLQPMSFSNVTVYAGDPWSPVAGAFLKNYKFKNLLCD